MVFELYVEDGLGQQDYEEDDDFDDDELYWVDGGFEGIYVIFVFWEVLVLMVFSEIMVLGVLGMVVWF